MMLATIRSVPYVRIKWCSQPTHCQSTQRSSDFLIIVRLIYQPEISCFCQLVIHSCFTPVYAVKSVLTFTWLQAKRNRNPLGFCSTNPQQCSQSTIGGLISLYFQAVKKTLRPKIMEHWKQVELSYHTVLSNSVSVRLDTFFPHQISQDPFLHRIHLTAADLYFHTDFHMQSIWRAHAAECHTSIKL